MSVSLDQRPLAQASGRIEVDTDGEGLTDVTPALLRWLADEGVRDGLLTVFIRHTSASLTIQENADTDVRADLVDALRRLAPQGAGYRHASEGPDEPPVERRARPQGVDHEQQPGHPPVRRHLPGIAPARLLGEPLGPGLAPLPPA